MLVVTGKNVPILATEPAGIPGPGVLIGGPMSDGVTWYEVLGVLPGSPAGEIWQAYQDKARQLRPDRISGAPPKVVTMAGRAARLLDEAWRVLGDPAARERYDVLIGVSQPGSGLQAPQPLPSGPSLDLSAPMDFVVGEVPAVLGGLAALAEWLAPSRGPSRHVVVPDVRALFFSRCLEVAASAGLPVSAVRLTEHPLPVDGLVIDQSPQPGGKVRRSATLTVQVWHPARPSSG
jgi:DnaJ domain/PASTA domain